jgi:recombination-promoting nuclease RpnB
VLQQPERAREYFRVVLPSHLADRLNFDTIRLESGSILDERLSESFSDLIYSVRLRDSDAGLYLSLLLEHKSSSDPFVTIQLGHYIFSALYRQVRGKKKPVPVLPVFY